MATELRWKSSDLQLLPDDGKRYEIPDGQTYVQKQPSWEHQFVAHNIAAELRDWSLRTNAGRPNSALGVIFADNDDVASKAGKERPGSAQRESIGTLRLSAACRDSPA